MLVHPTPRVLVWPAAMIVWGPGFATAGHRHHCVQLLMTTRGTLLIRGGFFEAFDDFSDFVEPISCETSKPCQVRGSSPRRGATALVSTVYKDIFGPVFEFVPGLAACNSLIGLRVARRAWI